MEIEFLTPEAYTERTRDEPTDLTEEEIAEAEQSEGLLRALGLVSGHIDLLESSNDLSDTGTLAFYDSEHEVVTVRGTEVTPRVAVTMVHELTHVLQDQIFDLDQLTEADATSGELAAFRALVEGDAGRIEDATRRRCRRGAGGDRRRRGQRPAAVEGEEIPEALEAIFGLPYALGGGFVAGPRGRSDDAVDAAFRSPPTTEEHLLDPESYFDDDEAIGVDGPDVGDAEVLDAGDFGAASLYLVLASSDRSGAGVRAPIGWGGDAYVNYLQDDRTCVDLNVTGDEPSDVDELDGRVGCMGRRRAIGDGLARPARAISCASTPATLESTLPAARDRRSTPWRWHVTRTAIITELIAAGADEGFVRCYVDAVLAGLHRRGADRVRAARRVRRPHRRRGDRLRLRRSRCPTSDRRRSPSILLERPGLQRVDTTEGRAYVLTQLVPPVGVGDEVVLNTTGVDLGLGTGGWHVVHWNLAQPVVVGPGAGHIMKLRYTSLQADTGSAEEHRRPLPSDLGGVPVVACTRAQPGGRRRRRAPAPAGRRRASPTS